MRYKPRAIPKESNKLKCVPRIVTKEFDKLKIGDYVICEQTFLGSFEKYTLGEITEIGHTHLHNHWFFVLDHARKVYEHEKKEFKVLELNQKK